jgi:uncharacterized protein (TIGR03067 family)
VPTSVVSCTIRAAGLLAAGKAAGVIPVTVAALTEGVLKAMLLTKLKTITVLLVLTVFAIGGSSFLCWTAAAQDAKAAPQGSERQDDCQPKTKADQAIQGVWTLVRGESDGKALRIEKDSVQLVVSNEFWIWTERGKDEPFTYLIDLTHQPRRIDLTARYNVGDVEKYIIRGIYEIEGDTLKVCESDQERPTKFSTESGSGKRLFTFKRSDNPKPGKKGNKQDTFAGLLFVELLVDKDLKYGVVKGVISAVERIDGIQGNFSVSIQQEGGIAARLYAAPELPYRDLHRLAEALKKAGVSSITIHQEERKGKGEGVERGSKRGDVLVPARSDIDQLQGTWKLVSMVDNGQRVEGVSHWTIKDTTAKLVSIPKDLGTGTITELFRFKVDQTTRPNRIDLVRWDKEFADAANRYEGIYSIAGDTLTICISLKKGHRPTGFESKDGSESTLCVLRRERPKGDQPTNEQREQVDRFVELAQFEYGGGIVSGTGIRDKGGFTVVPLEATAGHSRLAVSFAELERPQRAPAEFRVIAVDTEGNRHHPSVANMASAGGEGTTVFTIVSEFNVTPDRITLLVIQTRTQDRRR